MYRLKKIKGLTVSNSKLSLEARCSGSATEENWNSTGMRASVPGSQIAGIQRRWCPACIWLSGCWRSFCWIPGMLSASFLAIILSWIPALLEFRFNRSQVSCKPAWWCRFAALAHLQDYGLLMRKGLRRQVFLLWVASPIMQLAPFGYFNYIMIQFGNSQFRFRAGTSDKGTKACWEERPSLEKCRQSREHIFP